MRTTSFSLLIISLISNVILDGGTTPVLAGGLATKRDYRRPPPLPVPNPALAEFGRQVFKAGEMAPRAFVVQGVVYFGIARLFAGLTSAWVQISVFESKASAEAWLLQFLVH